MLLSLLHLLLGDAKTSAVLDMKTHLPETIRNYSSGLFDKKIPVVSLYSLHHAPGGIIMVHLGKTYTSNVFNVLGFVRSQCVGTGVVDL